MHSITATLLFSAAGALAAGPTFYNGTCTAETVSIRKEWRNLAESEKTAYLDAVNCLIDLPAQTSLSGVTNRFSDLQATHRDKTNATVNGVYVGDIIHSVVSSFTLSSKIQLNSHWTYRANSFPGTVGISMPTK